jgi:hypothetical protein
MLTSPQIHEFRLTSKQFVLLINNLEKLQNKLFDLLGVFAIRKRLKQFLGCTIITSAFTAFSYHFFKHHALLL